MHVTRITALRISIIFSTIAGSTYIVWRWLYSLNMSAWWIAVPLVVSETYSVLDSAFFSMTVWRAKLRKRPPIAKENLTVDVFITTYNEPIELVLNTALAAQKISYPHLTWILDDGSRKELREVAENMGIGYITRSAEWVGKPRHAKAGNLNNALMRTSGEFMLVLDADQVPDPKILFNTLGYFEDEMVALVQTPQEFGNVSSVDPLGSQAPLFYGPIQQGKDGWGAAFFCGSNAILRREALMQLGIRRYVVEIERSIERALKESKRVIEKTKRMPEAQSPDLQNALNQILLVINETGSKIELGVSLNTATYELHQKVKEISKELVTGDLVEIRRDLEILEEINQDLGVNWAAEGLDSIEFNLEALSSRSLSPLSALESVMALLQSLDVDRGSQAIPVMPIATISITEDMATSMRLHGMGWKSVYHHELLAIGLAPEDIGSMLTQRLRWAQGSLQVFFLENSLVQKGLSFAQRIMYFSTMWSYFSGFAAIFYFSAPIIYLCFGVLPVRTSPLQFFLRFIPFMIANQLIFIIAGKGISTWRGQQYSYALFPVWIKATTTAFANAWFGRSMTFVVTPKTRVLFSNQWRKVKWQLGFAIAFILALIIGITRYFMGLAPLLATAINVMWALFDLSLLKVLIPALRYKGFQIKESVNNGVV
jgi:cellulose synthase (UDP-forming)